MFVELAKKIKKTWKQFYRDYTICELNNYHNIDDFFKLLQSLSSDAPKLEKDKFLRVLDERINKGVYTYLIFVKNTEILVGTFSIIIEPKFIHAGKATLHLEDFVIAEAFRGNRIGKMILAVMTELICDKTNDIIHSIVLHTDEKISGFYETSGFKPKGIAMELKQNK